MLILCATSLMVSSLSTLYLFLFCLHSLFPIPCDTVLHTLRQSSNCALPTHTRLVINLSWNNLHLQFQDGLVTWQRVVIVGAPSEMVSLAKANCTLQLDRYVVGHVRVISDLVVKWKSRYLRNRECISRVAMDQSKAGDLTSVIFAAADDLFTPFSRIFQSSFQVIVLTKQLGHQYSRLLSFNYVKT